MQSPQDGVETRYLLPIPKLRDAIGLVRATSEYEEFRIRCPNACNARRVYGGKDLRAVLPNDIGDGQYHGIRPAMIMPPVDTSQPASRASNARIADGNRDLAGTRLRRA